MSTRTTHSSSAMISGTDGRSVGNGDGRLGFSGGGLTTSSTSSGSGPPVGRRGLGVGAGVGLRSVGADSEGDGVRVEVGSAAAGTAACSDGDGVMAEGVGEGGRLRFVSAVRAGVTVTVQAVAGEGDWRAFPSRAAAGGPCGGRG